MGRVAITTVIQAQGPATNSAQVKKSQLAAPMREEIYTPDKVSTPQGVSVALQKLSRHIDEVTHASRSFPMFGGTYWPNVPFRANTAVTLAHGCQSGLSVGWATFSVRPSNVIANAITNGRVVEVTQSANTGRITLSSNENCTVDLFFFTRPVAP